MTTILKIRDENIDLEKYGNILKSLLAYLKNKLEFHNPLSLQFLSDDDNSQMTLARTGNYDPDSSLISIHVAGRHIKDILRSLAHEVVHHHQNCSGKLIHDREYELGYAQKDEQARELEKEAFLMGNMLFRDWEDTLKLNNLMQESKIIRLLKEGECCTACDCDDEELEETIKKLEKQDEDEVDEASTTANITGYSLPLGASNIWTKDKKSKTNKR